MKTVPGKLGSSYLTHIAKAQRLDLYQSQEDNEKVYQKFKKSVKRLQEITGQKKPMVLSEMNADGDVNGPYDQAKKMQAFMNRLEADPEK